MEINDILKWEVPPANKRSKASLDTIYFDRIVDLSDSLPPVLLTIKTQQTITSDKDIESVEELLTYLEKLHDDIIYEEQQVRKTIERIREDNEDNRLYISVTSEGR